MRGLCAASHIARVQEDVCGHALGLAERGIQNSVQLKPRGHEVTIVFSDWPGIVSKNSRVMAIPSRSCAKSCVPQPIPQPHRIGFKPTPFACTP